jgi:hypothetical protein
MMHYTIICETGKGTVYAKFLTDLFKHYVCQKKNIIIIQDNSRIHKTDEVIT